MFLSQNFMQVDKYLVNAFQYKYKYLHNEGILLNKPPLEPQQAQHSSQAHFLFEHLCDGHTSIYELLAPFITDTSHERCRFSNQPQLLHTHTAQIQLEKLAKYLLTFKYPPIYFAFQQPAIFSVLNFITIRDMQGFHPVSPHECETTLCIHYLEEIHPYCVTEQLYDLLVQRRVAVLYLLF